MDGEPILYKLARVLRAHGLETVLIGNAAAALHGSPVATIDFDFFYRKTPANLKKLKAIAKELGAAMQKPFYPASGLIRLEREDLSLQADFMATIHGVTSFASLRSRAKQVDLEGCPLLVADLRDIIKSKRAADRPRDRAVLEILEKILREKTSEPKGKAGSTEAGERAG